MIQKERKIWIHSHFGTMNWPIKPNYKGLRLCGLTNLTVFMIFVFFCQTLKSQFLCLETEASGTYPCERELISKSKFNQFECVCIESLRIVRNERIKAQNFQQKSDILRA